MPGQKPLGLLARWRLRLRVRVVRGAPRTYHEDTWPVPEPPQEVLLARRYRAALRHALKHVHWYLTGTPPACDYCGTPLRRLRRGITVTVHPVTVYRTPPPDARDLHIVLHRGWAADVAYEPVAARCRKCRHTLQLPGGRWGVSAPACGAARNRHWLG